MKKYGMIDPKNQPKIENPKIKPEDLKPQVKNSKRRKEEHEIPRVPEDEIHVEDVGHDEIKHDPEHIEEASREIKIKMLKQQIEDEKRLRDKKEIEARGGDGELIDDRPDLKLDGFSFDMIF